MSYIFCCFNCCWVSASWYAIMKHPNADSEILMISAVVKLLFFVFFAIFFCFWLHKCLLKGVHLPKGVDIGFYACSFKKFVG